MRIKKLLTILVGLFYAAAAWASDEPLRPYTNMFDPHSRPAMIESDAAKIILIICGVIFVIVAWMLVYIMWKFRGSKTEDGKEPPQIYGSSHIEMAWTVIPILITVLLILITSRTIGELQDAKMPDTALKVRVIGHQWWWEIHYDGLGVVYANELHVPLSSRDPAKRVPTHLLLQSADVIHSFWVPQLAGKVDLIPNKNNDMWIEPYEPGVYFGNCAKYCGTQHANMLLRVVVQTPEDFQKWIAQQKAAVAAPVTPAEIEGQHEYFANSCVNCHTINGTISQGRFGPNLTKMMTRMTLGAGVAPMDESHIHAWVRDPQDLKVGCLMPDMQLLDTQVTAITAYLQTLK